MKHVMQIERCKVVRGDEEMSRWEEEEVIATFSLFHEMIVCK